MNDLMFLQVVSAITAQHRCEIVEVDLENRVVSISCPGGLREEIHCAIAIGEALEEAEQQKDVYFV